MTTAVVTIICIALIVIGGMTMSQGIITATDTTTLNTEEIASREGDITRTGLDTLYAENLSWADFLRITAANDGQTKLYNLEKWDLIVHYYDGTGDYHAEWLPYTSGTPGDNEWGKLRICLDGQTEVFEPGILNPEEEIIIKANLNPQPGDATNGVASLITPNGIGDSASFTSAGYALLIPRADDLTLGGTSYRMLTEGAPASGEGLTETTDLFFPGETSRKILHDTEDRDKEARHLFSLTGITTIPSGNWTVYYHGRTDGFDFINSNEANFNIDIIIRQEDGTVRSTIASEVAKGYLRSEDVDTWVTVSGTYLFPGYTVVDESDFLEIVYYGQTTGYGPSNAGYMQIMIDDSTLDAAEQTRIEA